jgi:hypothetical protein
MDGKAMKRFGLMAIMVGAATAVCGAAMAACAPAGVIHIVTTETTPGIDPKSPDAKPQSLFRQGSTKSRLEQQPDDSNQVHVLAVIDEPNIWTVNLADRTGRHMVDPGPVMATRAAVFSDDRISPKILELEYGCEAAFVAAHAPTAERNETVDGVLLEIHKFTDGAESVEILRKPGASDPLVARYYRSGKLVWAVRYDLYDTDAPTDPAMFAQPTGIKYQEASAKP